MTEEVSEYGVFDIRCKDVLEEEGVRYAGLLNEQGKTIAGGFKPGIVKLEKDQIKFKNFVDRVIEISLRTENEDALGKLNYVSCRRDKVILLSFPFPVSRNVLLISAEPTVNIEKLAKRVAQIFGDSNLFSAWDMQNSN